VPLSVETPYEAGAATLTFVEASLGWDELEIAGFLVAPDLI
jgi:hypothetical protein